MENSETPTKYFIRSRGKVMGPFTTERLKTLQARGQFSRVHEVSEDRKSWRPAAQLTEVFAPSDKNGVKSRSEEFVAEPQQPDIAAAGVNDAAWYLVVGDSQQGPISTADLRSFMANGRCGPESLVWKDDLPDWMAIRDVPELATAPVSRNSAASMPPTTPRPKSPRKIRWPGIVAGLLGLVGVAATVVFATTITDLDDALFQRIPSFSGGTITSLSGTAAEESLIESVGMVACGFRVILPDGTLVEELMGTGSCFAIAHDGHVLTNKHVIEETRKYMRADLLLNKIKEEQSLDIKPMIWVFFGSKQYTAEIVYVSANYDAAVLKVDRSTDSFFRLSSEPGLRGTRVFALGFPGAANTPLSEDELIAKMKELVPGKATTKIKSWFKPRDFEFSLTDGTISRIAEESGGRVWIQHNANTNPGNSGGPLVTKNGTVLGINTQMIIGNQESSANGLFFAISVDQLRDELDQHVDNIVWE